MANLSSTFREKINRLERTFAVSMVIFKKFQPIFKDMFVEPIHDPQRQPKSKKSRYEMICQGFFMNIPSLYFDQA